MRNAYNKTTPTNFLLKLFHKKRPAGSKKQVIALVWPEVRSVYLVYNMVQVEFGSL